MINRRNLGKKKREKGMAALAGALLVCLLSGQSVLAEGALQIGIDQYEVSEDGSIQVYVNQNAEDGFSPSPGESSLMIGKNNVEIESIRTFSELQEPVTCLCLVT